jgi:Biopolymer transport protein
MAEISSDHGGKEKKGKPKKMSTHVDFTPMVDLAFLLITFFMLTTTLIKPQTMELAMPPKNDKVEDPPEVAASRAVTVILGKNHKIFYYIGAPANGVDPKVETSDLGTEGLRKLLLQKNYSQVIKIREIKAKLSEMKITKEAFEEQKKKIMGEKGSPVVMIKATNGASYSDLVDVLDEMAICNIARYAIIDVTPYDLGLIKNLDI